MPPTGSQTLIAANVSPWYPPRSASSRVLPDRPRERQYWRHILIATSTATEPESAKKTCSSPAGVIRRGVAPAGSPARG